LQLGAKAVDVDQDGIEVEDSDGRRRIDAKTVIWSAGVQAAPLAGVLAERAGLEPDRGGRLTVAPDLSVPGYPDVFAIGDMIALQDVPGTAQPAIQEGRYVAKVVERRLAGAPPPSPFKYRDLGSMATIGRTRAIADIRGVKLTGLPAFLIWGCVHIAYLVGWGNRIDALGRWAWTLLGRTRRERLISLEPENRPVARTGAP
jgi:NADH dehydrogenase